MPLSNGLKRGIFGEIRAGARARVRSHGKEAGMTEQKRTDAATAAFILEAMPPDYDTLHAPLDFDAIEAMAEQYRRDYPDMATE